jgi:prepilin-type processing-associated H-X9-DG protein
LTGLLPPALSGSRKAHIPQCLNKLKQLQMGFIMFADDHGGKFPAQVPVSDGGSLEFIYTDHAFLHFEKNPLVKSGPQFTSLLVCPKDSGRQVATNLEALNDLGVSFFLNVDASVTNDPSKTIMTGDRCLQLNSLPAKPGLLTVTTNSDWSWTKSFHTKGGILGFVDGHARYVREGKLNEVIQQQPTATNRFAVP